AHARLAQGTDVDELLKVAQTLGAYANDLNGHEGYKGQAQREVQVGRSGTHERSDRRSTIRLAADRHHFGATDREQRVNVAVSFNVQVRVHMVSVLQADLIDNANAVNAGDQLHPVNRQHQEGDRGKDRHDRLGPLARRAGGQVVDH